MSRRTKDNTRQSQNKKFQELIQRFDYYAETVSQSFELGSVPREIQGFRHMKAELGNRQYHYLEQSRDSYKQQEHLSKVILNAVARESLVPSNAHIHGSTSSKIIGSLQQKDRHFGYPESKVDIVVLEATDNSKLTNSHRTRSLHGRPSSVVSSFKQNKNCRNFNVFVLHFPSEHHSLWSYLAQKITLREDRLSEEGQSLPIRYEAVIVFPKETWFQKNVKGYFQTSPQTKELTAILKESGQRLNLFESTLAKTLIKAATAERLEDNNVHPQFKRQSKLPAGQYKKFQKIKSEVYAYWSKIHKEHKMNPYFLDNLICRYLMVKKYDQKQTLQDVKKYLDWQKDMRIRYKMESFKHYDPLQIFQYIGKDYQGRPLLFFRATKYVPANIKDLDNYIDYNSFIIELFLQDQMEGYVDEYIIIGDYTGFGTDNFKYSVAKQFSEVSDQYFPQRQYKLILFGVGSFGQWIYKVLKPVLPEFILSKIAIFGHEREDLQNFMKKILDINQLPKYVFEEVSTEEASSTGAPKRLTGRR